jgi:surfeit locus 1 family protein
MLNRRVTGFLVFACLIVLGCVRLGFWQLDRLAARRAANRALAGRLAAPTADLAEILRDTATMAYRAVRVAGRYDYEREFVLATRSRQGSPGVHLITPFIRADNDTAILVNRGWVYSPDGMVIDAAAWHEPRSLEHLVVGHIERPLAASGPVFGARTKGVIRRLAPDSLAPTLPYPLARVVVIQEVVDTMPGATATHPIRLETPRLSEGAHRSYAVQWFSFAFIGIVGMGAVLRRRRSPVPPSPPSPAGER